MKTKDTIDKVCTSKARLIWGWLIWFILVVLTFIVLVLLGSGKVFRWCIVADMGLFTMLSCWGVEITNRARRL